MQRKSKKYSIICVQFLTELQRPGLHQAYMARQVTLLVPTNAAMAEYRGRRGEDLVLNHVINQIVLEEALVTGARLSSLVVGSPPLWVTRRLELQTNLREDFTTKAFSWLKVLASAFTFKTLLRHYVQGGLNMGHRCKDHK